MKVKVCGVTRLDDALGVIEAGADMIGFNFYPSSPRFLSPLRCASLVSALDERRVTVIKVGVFVNETVVRMLEIMSECGLDLAQLSGDEPPSTLDAFGSRGFKAIRPRDLEEAERLAQVFLHEKLAPMLLLDRYSNRLYGGSGKTGDWELAAKVAKSERILLAGGLNPENVAEAVEKVHPWGVDVASGVEASPGRKDVKKVKKFIQAARQSGEEILNVNTVED